MTVCFVTGTDTGVGKTVVTAALAAILGGRGRDVAMIKPAQTGVRPGEAGDVDEVCRLAGPLDVREGARLPDPLSPDRAALVAGVDLPGLPDQACVICARRTSATTCSSKAPAASPSTWAARSACSSSRTRFRRGAGQAVAWIVVARACLGTLNHSKLTVGAIQDRGFAVQGVVIGSWPADPGLAERHNRDDDLAAHTGVPVLGAVPEGAAALPPADFQARAADWIRLDFPVLPT